MSVKKGNTVHDLSGMKFGKLTVLNFVGVISGNSMWKCLCDCGKETITRSLNLRTGNSKSCGCGNIDQKRKLAFKLKELNKKDPHLVANRVIFLYYKKGAYKRNLEFNLNEELVTELTKSLQCHYCGGMDKNIYLVIRKDGNVPIEYMGIDRIDSSKGYNPDNVVPCCKYCNGAKRDRPLDEFLKWVKNVYNHSIR